MISGASQRAVAGQEPCQQDWEVAVSEPELGPVPRAREDKVNALFNLFKSNA